MLITISISPVLAPIAPSFLKSLPCSYSYLQPADGDEAAAGGAGVGVLDVVARRDALRRPVLDVARAVHHRVAGVVGRGAPVPLKDVAVADPEKRGHWVSLVAKRGLGVNLVEKIGLGVRLL